MGPCFNICFCPRYSSHSETSLIFHPSFCPTPVPCFTHHFFLSPSSFLLYLLPTKIDSRKKVQSSQDLSEMSWCGCTWVVWKQPYGFSCWIRFWGLFYEIPVLCNTFNSVLISLNTEPEQAPCFRKQTWPLIGTPGPRSVLIADTQTVIQGLAKVNACVRLQSAWRRLIAASWQETVLTGGVCSRPDPAQIKYSSGASLPFSSLIQP